MVSVAMNKCYYTKKNLDDGHFQRRKISLRYFRDLISKIIIVYIYTKVGYVIPVITRTHVFAQPKIISVVRSTV